MDAFDRLRGLQPSERAQASLEFSAKVGLMAARGIALVPRMGTPKGRLLVGRGVRMRNSRCVHVHGQVIIEDFAEIQGLSKNGIVLRGQNSIGAFSMIRPSGYYSREIGEGMVLGSRSSIGPYGYVGCSGFVDIGDDVLIGPRVSIHAEDHEFSDSSSTVKSQGVKRAPVTIEDDVWIGGHVVITSGVTIGRGAIVAAGAIVTRDVPQFSIVGGVPAREIAHRPGF